MLVGSGLIDQSAFERQGGTDRAVKGAEMEAFRQRNQGRRGLAGPPESLDHRRGIATGGRNRAMQARPYRQQSIDKVSDKIPRGIGQIVGCRPRQRRRGVRHRRRQLERVDHGGRGVRRGEQSADSGADTDRLGNRVVSQDVVDQPQSVGIKAARRQRRLDDTVVGARAASNRNQQRQTA